MIDVTMADGVAELVLNAPEKMNALNEASLKELGDALSAAERAGVRALLLRGEGRGFCAGRDIAGLDLEADRPTEFLTEVVTPVFQQLAAFPAPTFASVHGACLGLGLGLAIAADIVYVAESAKIGSPFAKLGAALDSGGHWLFVERLGAHRAMDLMVTADLMSGAEAVTAGLFSRALPDVELLEFTRGKVATAAAGATASFRESKQIVAAIRDQRLGLWEAITLENAAQGDLHCCSPDYREGMTAFTEKRTPTFTGH